MEALLRNQRAARGKAAEKNLGTIPHLWLELRMGQDEEVASAATLQHELAGHDPRMAELAAATLLLSDGRLATASPV